MALIWETEEVLEVLQKMRNLGVMNTKWQLSLLLVWIITGMFKILMAIGHTNLVQPVAQKSMLQETLLQIRKRQIEIIPMLTIVNFVDIIL